MQIYIFLNSVPFLSEKLPTYSGIVFPFKKNFFYKIRGCCNCKIFEHTFKSTKGVRGKNNIGYKDKKN